jgi:hypothetical protein
MSFAAWQAFIFTHFSQEKISKNQQQQSVISAKVQQDIWQKTSPGSL